jgi:hypothetical protein
MTATTITRVVLSAMVVTAAVGAADAAVGGQWDLFMLFVALAVAAIVLMVRTFVGRPLVAVRADLVRWMATEAATADEPTAQVADRAIAAWRSGLTTPDDPSPTP